MLGIVRVLRLCFVIVWVGGVLPGEGGNRVSGVVRECLSSLCDWTVSKMACDWDDISFVFGSRLVARLGWSLALGWRPAEVFRFAWYRLGIFLYRASSFFLSLFMSSRFAFLMIEEMAWWHREGMSSMFGGSLSWRIVVAWVGVGVSFC